MTFRSTYSCHLVRQDITTSKKHHFRSWEWAFECHLNSDSTISYVVDAASGGAAEFTTTYNYGNWVEIKHVIDTHADVMDVLIDGVWVGELPYDGDQIGGINFYAAGDGVTCPCISWTTFSLPKLASTPTPLVTT